MFQPNSPDGVKHVQSRYTAVRRTKYCRPLSEPKPVPLSHRESEAEQTPLLGLTLTKGNVKHRTPGGEMSPVKRYSASDPFIIFLKHQSPAAREGSSALQRLKGTCSVVLRSPQLPSRSSTKVEGTDADPAPLSAETKPERSHRILCRRGLWDSLTWTGRRPNNLVPFLISVGF